FIPSLGTREVIAFGSGISLPSRLQFKELPAAVRPNSEAAGNTRSDASANMTRDLIAAVIERWRSASLTNRSGSEFDNVEAEAQPVAHPAPQAAPAYPPRPAAAVDQTRQGILRRPLDGGAAPGASVPPGLSRLR